MLDILFTGNGLLRLPGRKASLLSRLVPRKNVRGLMLDNFTTNYSKATLSVQSKEEFGILFCMSDDENFMLLALKEAQKAFLAGEVPVGAVLVKDNIVLSRGHNCVESTKKATKHAEVVAIECAPDEDWRLLNTTLYTTLEPCTMCLGALQLARVKKIVYAAPDLRHGACGSFVSLHREKHPTHQIEVVGGVLEDMSKELLQAFFKERRKGRHDARDARRNDCIPGEKAAQAWAGNNTEFDQ